MKRNLVTEAGDVEASNKHVKSEVVDLPANLIQRVSSDGIVGSITAKEETSEIRQDDQAIIEPTKHKVNEASGVKFRKKTVALFMCYNGFGYFGMQFNAGFKTIEGELLAALTKIGAIIEEPKFQLAKLNFQRASKTDKGVSAVRQIVSLKMDTARDYLEALNSELSPQIRVLRILRTTQSFNCKYYCSSRFYQYLCPTFAFSPTYEQTYEGYRIDEPTIKELNDVLSIFKGTHNFHNYTSSVKADDPSCNRYIMDISTAETFTDIKTNLEFISIHLNGQSFMLHQIRKMIGITIAIMKKYADREIIKRSFLLNTVETPRAPSLGLMLDRQEFKGYNRKFGDDGIHEPITWESVESQVIEFRDKYIYPHIIQQEADERTMFHWLGHLKKHRFSPEATTEENKLDTSKLPDVTTAEEITSKGDKEVTNEAKLESATGVDVLVGSTADPEATNVEEVSETTFCEESIKESELVSKTTESKNITKDMLTPDVISQEQ